jgi:hypothetical protein
MVSIKRPSRSIPGALGAAGLASLLLALGGCGGSSSRGVAHLSSASGSVSRSSDPGPSDSSAAGGPAEAQQAMVAFAQCMRTHGVSNFPEPHEGHILIQGGPGGQELNPRSAQFQAAQKTCQRLLPNGGRPTAQEQAQMQERALKFSACMRSHGVPSFPNPSFEGGGAKLSLKAGSGPDPRSPQFQAAQRACRAYFGPPGGGSGGETKSPSGPGGGSGSGSGAALAP